MGLWDIMRVFKKPELKKSMSYFALSYLDFLFDSLIIANCE